MLENPIPKRIYELDALRGIAVLMVCIRHFTMYKVEVGNWLNFCSVFIELFFIISAFAVTLSLERTDNLKKFAINRFTRIYPIYWICASFTFLVMILYKSLKTNESIYDLSLVQYLVNLTMFQSFFGIKDLDGQYWTLIIELSFYAFIIILAVLKQVKSFRNIGFIWCISLLVVYFVQRSSDSLGLLTWSNFIGYFPMFYAGMMVYYLYKNTAWRTVLNYTLIGFSFVTQTIIFHQASIAANYTDQLTYALFMFGFFLICIALIHRKTEFFAWQPLLYLGKISYVLYLLHQYIAQTILIPILQYRFGINFWVTVFLITLPFCIILAALFNHFIEEPLSHWLRAKLYQKFNIKHNKPKATKPL